MAAGQPWLPPLMSSSVRTERLLRAACAAMAAAGALLLGFSAQTKTVLFVQKKAVPKDVQALWVLILAAAAAAAYHAAQLARCLCMDRLATRGGGGCGAGCRRLGRAMACATFLLDKGCAYMVFATAVAALQACFVGLLGVEALQWSKLCNIYTRFCVQGGAGMVCSLMAGAGMAVLSAFSARDVFRRRRGGPCSPAAPAARHCVQV